MLCITYNINHTHHVACKNVRMHASTESLASALPPRAITHCVQPQDRGKIPDCMSTTIIHRFIRTSLGQIMLDTVSCHDCTCVLPLPSAVSAWRLLEAIMIPDRRLRVSRSLRLFSNISKSRFSCQHAPNLARWFARWQNCLRYLRT